MKSRRMLIFSATQEHFYIRNNELDRVLKLTQLMSIFTSKKIWKFVIKNQLTKSGPKRIGGWKVPSLMPIRVNTQVLRKHNNFYWYRMHSTYLPPSFYQYQRDVSMARIVVESLSTIHTIYYSNMRPQLKLYIPSTVNTEINLAVIFAIVS